MSLFINISIENTFKVIEVRLYGEGVSEHNCFPKKLCKRLCDLCCRDNLFILDNKLYKQNVGAPMGGVILAFKPVSYKRYEDDTFL